MTGLGKLGTAREAWLFLFCFSILAGTYVIKPLRDELPGLMGEGWDTVLFRWTLVVMIVVNPIFSAVVNRTTRVGFMKGIYRFFSLNLLLFIGLFKYLESTGQMPRSGAAVQIEGAAFLVAGVFFVWASVFNLFAVSVFWALLADLYSGEQGKKVFGFIGAGGTLGGVAGSLLTSKLVDDVGGPTNMLFVTVVFLEVAVQAMLRATRGYQEPERPQPKDRPNALSGIGAIFRSPYLLGICCYLFFYAFTSSLLWFQKQDIVKAFIPDREPRVQYFADINTYINVFTLIIQLFLTSRLLPLIGLGAGLSLVPVITFIGFMALAQSPTLWVIGLFEVTRSTCNYAISRPSREVLFTAVSRQEKYLSKSFIDTFVYRGGDTMASFATDAIKATTRSLAALSYSGTPLCVLYLLVALGLGKAHARKSADSLKGTDSSKATEAQNERGPKQET
jgi:AAA family ATP:ADP antiporter